MARGGIRAGAGCKRKLKPTFASKARADSVLSKLGKPYRGVALPEHIERRLPTEDDLWLSLLLSDDQRIKLDALKYLKNRAEGEPSHQVNHTIQHLIAMEEGRQLSRQMLALKQKTKLLEVAAEPVIEDNGTKDSPAEIVNKDHGTNGTPGNS